ncbi:ubiquitin-conjugating enzyme [Niveomyces insectorum RCEF 264]|uniref:Ubiquitin-conjugating enzyme n=1 Tax=Niveomyces insectorum RCEF 264 TaxID=1081102 RepID=A0A162J9B7_9HYPO|nr:ubiquitin-conjugating enzyme [Niveomyces insectorum RCEF 264]
MPSFTRTCKKVLNLWKRKKSRSDAPTEPKKEDTTITDTEPEHKPDNQPNAQLDNSLDDKSNGKPGGNTGDKPVDDAVPPPKKQSLGMAEPSQSQTPQEVNISSFRDAGQRKPSRCAPLDGTDAPCPKSSFCLDASASTTASDAAPSARMTRVTGLHKDGDSAGGGGDNLHRHWLRSRKPKPDVSAQSAARVAKNRAAAVSHGLSGSARNEHATKHGLGSDGPSSPSFEQWWAAALQSRLDSAMTLDQSTKASVLPTASLLLANVSEASGEPAIHTFCRRLSHFTCQGCGKLVIVGVTKVAAGINKMTVEQRKVPSGFTCPYCSAVNCFGCGTATVDAMRDNTIVDEDGVTVSYCCEVGLTVLIWALCCGIGTRMPTDAMGAKTDDAISRAAQAASQLDETAAHLVSNPGFGAPDSSSSSSSSSNHAETNDISLHFEDIFNFGSLTPIGSSHMPATSALLKKQYSRILQATATPSGVGYGSGSWMGPMKVAQGTSVQQTAKIEDSMHQAYFSALSTILHHPTTKSKAGSHLQPETCNLICVFLARSPLLFKAAELLRNSSIDDVASRFKLYRSLFRFLLAISRHPILATVLSQPQVLYSKDAQLFRISCAEHDSPGLTLLLPSSCKTGASRKQSVQHNHGRGISLMTLTHQLAELCKHVLDQVVSVPASSPDFNDGNGPNMLTICRSFVYLSTSLSSNHPQCAAASLKKDVRPHLSLLTTTEPCKRIKLGDAAPSSNGIWSATSWSAASSSKRSSTTSTSSADSAGSCGSTGGTGITSNNNNTPNSHEEAKMLGTSHDHAGCSEYAATASQQRQDDERKAWHRDRCVEGIDDDQLSEAHAFARDMLWTKQSPKGRMKRIISDITMLKSSLPEGIYVRHGMARVDAMKILIAGPKGTPYEGGLFEFDLLCTSEYPQKAPKMRLRTTGQGTVRFNPNLYANGTVCLSLLGTWGGGQSWHAEHSTLLQILVSIQAMIFCEEPYYNEPGREHTKNDLLSAQENYSLQGHTIEHAMLYWLRRLRRQSSPTTTTTTSATTKTAADAYGDQAGAAWPPKGVATSSKARPETRIWDEVVRQHFTVHGRDIINTVMRTPEQRMIKELKEKLQYHGMI